MTTKTVKVGDVVAWDEVPSGAMVYCCLGAIHKHMAMRIGDNGSWVQMGVYWQAWANHWTWDGEPYYLVEDPTIVALNLTGNETADELRALAEAFERDHPAA